MRKVTGLVMIIASLAFYTFGLATPASADPGGNNGDVKIHDTGTATEDHRNEPHVCNFYIDGFNFDGRSSGTWRIESWAPTGSGVKATNSWGPADANGNWHSNPITLPDGHYKLFAKQTSPLAPGGEKQKVFWVECGPSSTTGGTTNNGGGTTNNGGGTTNNGGGTTPNGTDTTSNGSGTTTSGTTSGTTSNAGGTTNSGTTSNGTGTTPNGNAVAGFETAPNAVGSVSPIVEVPGGSNQQSPNVAQAGVQNGAVAGVQSLPSTSTSGTPALPLAAMGLAIMALGGVLLRRYAQR